MDTPASQSLSTLTPFQRWVLAARPRTLPAAAAPVIVGTAAAIQAGAFRLGPALAALLAALLLQIGANLANDVFDYKKGVDTEERLGPVRVTQAGLLAPHQVLTGMWVTFGTAALLGVYLTLTAGWPVLVIGVLAILAAIAYTGGPFPYGYRGFGELFVFLFFGLAAVCGTFYVQARQLIPLAVWAAMPMGFLASAILVVNNLRDLETDRASGRKTLSVRFGRGWTRREYLVFVGAAYFAPLIMWLDGVASPWVLLTWLSLPLVPRLARSILTEKGRPLNQTLAGTGQLELVYGILFSIGIILG